MQQPVIVFDFVNERVVLAKDGDPDADRLAGGVSSEIETSTGLTPAPA